jgi:glycosyltransferase involved in cell wall biosynthesis
VKVLFLQKMAGISGSERYLLGILPVLHARGVEVAFLAVQHPANAAKNRVFIEDLTRAGVPVYVIDSRLPLSPWLVWRIARLVRRQRFDVLHTNLIHADVWGALVKRLFIKDLRLLSVKHGYSESFQTRYGLDPGKLKWDLMALLTRWAGRYADDIVCISSALQSFLVRGKLIDSDKATTIPYGFDFSSAPTEVGPGGLRFGDPQLIVVGRLVPVKQHALLITILPALLQDFPKLSVVMVGAGPLREDLEIKTSALGLSAHVRWEGFRSNIHDYIRDSDIMVVPSAAEGFGLVVLEAWFHEKPVVAFAVPAINEIVEAGVDGELVEPFNQTALLETLRLLAADQGRQRTLGQNGKQKQKQFFGLEVMCDRTVTVLRSLAAQRDGGLQRRPERKN